jgi:hypothetical protein
MRDVRRVEPAHRAGAEREILAVREHARGPVEGVGVQHRIEAPAEGYGLRSDREEMVQRAGLVALVVREGDVAQPCHRQHGRDRLAGLAEHPPRPRVVEERRLVQNEIPIV